MSDNSRKGTEPEEFEDDTNPSARFIAPEPDGGGSADALVDDHTVMSVRSAAAALAQLPDDDTMLTERKSAAERAIDQTQISERRPAAEASPPGIPDDQTQISGRHPASQPAGPAVPDDSTRIGSRSRSRAGNLDDATGLSTRNQSSQGGEPERGGAAAGGNLRSRAERVAAQRRASGAERRRVVTSSARIAYDPTRQGVADRTYSVRALPVVAPQAARPIAPPEPTQRIAPKQRRAGNWVLIGALAVAAIGIIGAMVWLALSFGA